MIPKITITLLGSQTVGKSNIMQKCLNDRFEEFEPTVGIEFLTKTISHKCKNYRIQFWDTSGQERFRSLIPSYIKDANYVLLIFDVTSSISFHEIKMWVNLFNEYKGKDSLAFLVGNKIDKKCRMITSA